MTSKILQCGLYWPTLFQDAYIFCSSCDRCQRMGSTIRRNMMPLNLILVVHILMCGASISWDPFFFFCHQYISIAIDYVSKWVEATPCRTNNHKVVMRFLKRYIVSCFGFPRAIFSDGGTYFCKKIIQNSFSKILHHT